MNPEHYREGSKAMRQPANEANRTEKARNLILQSYDGGLFQRPIQDYYGHSDFANWGYWKQSTKSQKEACEALMEKLLGFIPRKQGSILDIACGTGATTRYLTKYYAPENITGINISEKQLQRAKVNAPGCKFLVMDATHLLFQDNSFDAVISVEAAFHFCTRRRFLSEVYRVLRPGGYLVLSDILFCLGAEDLAPMLHIQNWVASPAAYGGLLRNAGFQQVRVIDATEECWRRFDRYNFNYVLKKLQSKEINWKTFEIFMTRRGEKKAAVKYYLLACARKGVN
jgi:MPBQ/MSBQ methyltransferase